MFSPDGSTPRHFLLAALLAAVLAISGCARQNAPPGEVTEEITARSYAFDVPFVPSHDSVLRAMFELAKPTADDFVIDLGSGDGRIVITAAREYGAQGFGVDLNEELVKIANYRAQQAGVADRARFHVRNLFETDIRPATVLTMYLLPSVVLELRPKLLAELRPGTRILSHDFHLGDWQADEVRSVDTGEHSVPSTVYLWVVPGDAHGAWRWELRRGSGGAEPRSYTASIRQTYQRITGETRTGSAAAPLDDARIDGKRIRFSVVDGSAGGQARQHFDGMIEGDRITGTVRLSGGGGEATLPWEAHRTGPPE